MLSNLCFKKYSSITLGTLQEISHNKNEVQVELKKKQICNILEVKCGICYVNPLLTIFQYQVFLV